MNARRRDGNQIRKAEEVPLEKAEQLLTVLVNLRHPNDEKGQKRTDFLTRARTMTARYWPDLWSTVDAEGERAESVLLKIRWYLREAWDTRDPHKQDWLIHRAREHYHYVRVQHDPEVDRRRQEFNAAVTADDARNASSWLNIAFQNALDNPPANSAFEEALFHLQEVSRIPSRRPLVCPNPHCQSKYFISQKKGQKFCSPECARPSLLASKRKYDHEKRSTR
jgi:hypothetical protein